MSDIRLDRGKAERLIAQFLRDDVKLPPAAANGIATRICDRLQASMAMPTRPALQGYRMISQWPSFEQRPEIAAELGKQIEGADEETVRALWEIVYRYGRDLPDDVVV